MGEERHVSFRTKLAVAISMGKGIPTRPGQACGWVLILLLLLLQASRAVGASDETSRPLRVVTYNLLHGGPTSGVFRDGSHLEERLEMTICELQELAPDIIALQEASSTWRHGHVAQRIAQRLGLHVVFAAATERLVGLWPLDWFIVNVIGFKEGPAILTRFPVVGFDIYDLPRCQQSFDPRIVLRATLRTPWGALVVFSTHTRRGDDCQLERVGKIVQEPKAEPSLLMGDLNASESSPALVAFRNQTGAVDAFRSVHPDAPGFTVWQRITAERPTVSRRVDFIFALNGDDGNVRVRSSRVLLDQPGHLKDGSPLWPSDHYGVFAEVEMASSTGFENAARGK